MTPRRRPIPAPTIPAGPPALPMPTAWARERIAAARAAGPLPEYGSEAWTALPEDDPRKIGAALIAAEVHRYEAATLADRLRRELEEARHVAAVLDLEDAVERGARASMAADKRNEEHGRRVADRGARMLAGRYPTAAELAERRDDHVGFWRARAQEARIAAVPPLAELMRPRTA